MVNYIFIHNLIKNSGKHNFELCRIPIYSKLNIEFIRRNLLDYEDKQVCDFLEFGWPIGHIGKPFTSTVRKNHGGATEFPEDINKYLNKESDYRSVLGPFKNSPFEQIALSPLNSVPKRDSQERRVILDLSFPESISVNDGILKDNYLGENISVSYPSVDDLISLIKIKPINRVKLSNFSHTVLN